MAAIDVVKYDSNDKEFAWKYPSENLRLGSQLVVKTSQRAFFIKGGKVLDEFNEGTYTLKTGNIPILDKIINIPFGSDSPFQAEVWFVNLISILDNKWGTPVPIQLEDPKYNIVVPVRAFGQFGISIADPKNFLQTLVGNLKSFSTEKVVEYFSGKVISSTTSAIGKKMILDGISFLQIHVFLDEISEYCKEKIKKDLEQYGINLDSFHLISINVPESDPSVIKLKAAKDLAAKVKITGKDLYQMDRSFDVLDKAAQNEGMMGGTISAGLGIGLGLGIGNQTGSVVNKMVVGQNLQSQQTPSPPPVPNQNALYFVLINNEQSGPYSIESVNRLIQLGQINKDTFVWKAGMSDWASIMVQSDFKETFGIIPPPPPPPTSK
jgi:membrane protease subunit (stomatin/prohibitin family)